MKKPELKTIIAKGEDSPLQFKKDVDSNSKCTTKFIEDMTGNSVIRNPILVSYVAKGLLPYRGLGSGIKRALEAWPKVDFVDDRDGCLFTATVHRKVERSSGIGSGKMDLLPVSPEKVSGKTSGERSGKLSTIYRCVGRIYRRSGLPGVTSGKILAALKSG